VKASEVTAAIRDQWETQWAALGRSAVTTLWPNEQGSSQTPDAPFARLSWRFGSARIAKVGGGSGNNVQRQSGEVIVSLFEAQSYGEETRIRALADDAATIFRTFRSGDLRFYAAFPVGEGQVNGNYYQIDVLAPFEFDLVG
jgi:hypothetical protein